MGSQEAQEGVGRLGDFEESNRPDVVPGVEVEAPLSSDWECPSDSESFESSADRQEELSTEGSEKLGRFSVHVCYPEPSNDHKTASQVSQEVWTDAETLTKAAKDSDTSAGPSKVAGKTKIVAEACVQADIKDEKKEDDKKKKDSKKKPSGTSPIPLKPLNECLWLWKGGFVIIFNWAIAVIELVAYYPETVERSTIRAKQMEEGALFRREPYYNCFQYFESEWGAGVRDQGQSEKNFIVGYFMIEVGAILVLMINCYVWKKQRSSKSPRWEKLPPKHATMFQNFSLKYQSCLLLFLISYALCPFNFSLVIRPSDFRLDVYLVSLVIRFVTWVFVINDCDTNKNYNEIMKKRMGESKAAAEIDVEKSDKGLEAQQAGDSAHDNDDLPRRKQRRIFPSFKELCFDTVEDHRWSLKSIESDPEKEANLLGDK